MLSRIQQIRYNPITILKQTFNFPRMSSAGSASRRVKQLAAQMSTDATQQPEVLFKEHFAARIYILNRPKQLNVLSHDMVRTLSAQIEVGQPNAIWGDLESEKETEMGRIRTLQRDCGHGEGPLLRWRRCQEYVHMHPGPVHRRTLTLGYRNCRYCVPD
jgi:hypothetical protein